ncbi:MAG: transposase [Acidobacteriota bacterium]|nr:transposase [Acidobacteriota bacterium]
MRQNRLLRNTMVTARGPIGRMRANWHPHLHLIVTDGGFRPDRTFVSWPVHDTARLTEAVRRAVLRLFVRLALFDEDQATGMLSWPHSGFHVHTAVWVSGDDRAFATRLARYCARNPVTLERLTYERAAKAVTYRSDKSEGPTAGAETADPLRMARPSRVSVKFGAPLTLKGEEYVALAKRVEDAVRSL